MNKYGLAALAVISLALMGAGCNKTTQEPSTQPTPEPPMTDDSAMMMKSETEATHTVNLEKSTLAWSGEKITGSGHKGTVPFSNGSLTINEDGQIEGGEFTLDLSALEVEESDKAKDSVEKHLKSADFFDTENYPTGTFVITSVEQGENGLVINGDLTMKGITHPVSFPATLETSEEAMLSTASVTIDRSLWDIRYGSGSFFDDLGDNAIKDEIEISLSIEAKKI